MHVQLSFLEGETIADGVVAVWSSLDPEQRAEAVATLARLMAKRAVADPAQAVKATADE